MRAYPVIDIAKWMIFWAEAEDADLSNLKLQKLLYYAQGHHLGAKGVPLFSEPIRAWSHGPVVQSVYNKFRDFGSADIRLPQDDPFEWDDIDPETTDFLIRIWNTYAGYGAWQLRNMTHREDPWRKNFEPGYGNPTIPQQDLAVFFKQSTFA